LQRPFSKDAADYARKLALESGRHIDPAKAVKELVNAWKDDELLTRRESFLARRLSAQQSLDADRWFPPAITAAEHPAPADDADVVDLDTRRRAHRASEGLDLVEDIDVFEQYYNDYPEGSGLEILE
jgi:hypothetical protein